MTKPPVWSPCLIFLNVSHKTFGSYIFLLGHFRLHIISGQVQSSMIFPDNMAAESAAQVMLVFCMGQSLQKEPIHQQILSINFEIAVKFHFLLRGRGLD